MDFVASVSSRLLERKTLFQCVAFIVTYLSYASYYLTRKPLSVIKSNLVAFGIPVWVLGVYDALFLLVYSLGQFVSGYTSDKLGSKSVVITGLFISSLATASCGIIGLSVFSFSPLTVSILFGISWTINSFGQSLGWSPCIKTMTNWFEKEKRGMIIGFYSTCCVLGSFIGTIIATAMLTALGWQFSLIVPAIVIFVVGILNFFIWIKDPASYGINIHNNNCDDNNLNNQTNDSISSDSDILNETNRIDLDEDSNSQKSNNDLDIELKETSRSIDDSSEININTLSSTSPSTTTTIVPEEGSIDIKEENFTTLLDNNQEEELSNVEVDSNYYKNENLFILEMIFICLIFFVVKLVMYSVLFWMPYYLHSELNYSESTASYISLAYDAGGFFGSIIIGYISDRVYKFRSVVLSFNCLFCLLSLSLFVSISPRKGEVYSFISLFFVGFFNFSCETITTVLSNDSVSEEYAGRVIGILNGFGSFGAFLQALLIPLISGYSGWQSVMLFLCSLAFIGYTLTIPLMFFNYQFLPLKLKK